MPEVTCPNCEGKGAVSISDEEDRVGRAMVVVLMEEHERYELALRRIIAPWETDTVEELREIALRALWC